MAEGRSKWASGQVAALLAAIWSGNQNLKKPRFFRPQEFDPYARKAKPARAVVKRDIGILKTIFVDA